MLLMSAEQGRKSETQRVRENLKEYICINEKKNLRRPATTYLCMKVVLSVQRFFRIHVYTRGECMFDSRAIFFTLSFTYSLSLIRWLEFFFYLIHGFCFVYPAV